MKTPTQPAPREAAHTPGPWKVYPPDAVNPSRAMVSAHDGQVVIYNAPLTGETAANARLIAAAPALVEALEGLTQTVLMLATCPFGHALNGPRSGCNCNYHDAADAARAALALAGK